MGWLNTRVFDETEDEEQTVIHSRLRPDQLAK
jgi:hypothetical protein